MNLLRRIRRFLAGGQRGPAYHAATHRYMAGKAYACMVAFYAVNLFFAYQLMYLLMDSYGNAAPGLLAIEPLWPIFYATPANLPQVANALALANMGAAVAVVLWPHQRRLRVLAFATFLQAVALEYSFGALNQKELWWLWTMLVFTLFPSLRCRDMLASRRQRQHMLDVFGLAIGLNMVFYFLTGYWKLYYGFVALSSPTHLGMFSHGLLANILANRMALGHVSPLLGKFFVQHPLLGNIVFVWVVYIELTSVFVWMRPELHRLWGTMLIFFHVGTWLLMSIPFYLQPPLLGILLLCSPFAPERGSLRRTVRRLPGLEWLRGKAP